MKAALLSAAVLLGLAGCSKPPAQNATITNMNETAVNEADVTEVPDESADANAAQDADSADSMNDEAVANEAANSVRNATPATPLTAPKPKVP